MPYASAAPVVAQYGDALPARSSSTSATLSIRPAPGSLTPDGSSAAQETAEAAPAGAHVVKAFNTLFFGHVLGHKSGRGHCPLGTRPSPVDDAEAKARVSAFIESLNMRPLGTGDLKMAHWLEGAGLLMVAPASRQSLRRLQLLAGRQHSMSAGRVSGR